MNAFSECPLAVAVAVDGVLYQNTVFEASHSTRSHLPNNNAVNSWGERPVLLLFGVRLGIEAVHPTYYDSVKVSLM